MGRFEEMQAFVRTAEAQSFTAAAQRLGLSKSIVSQRVADLEARLGVRLINRTTRRLSLTEAGAASSPAPNVRSPRRSRRRSGRPATARSCAGRSASQHP